jgi:methylphosphotriester-DNA--protein-cysteine methyltransferase
MAAPEVPSSHKYLLDAPTLTLATIDPHGRPQLSQIWFLAEDGVVRTALNTLRQKVKNLEANPHATVFILDTANPQKYLEIRLQRARLALLRGSRGLDEVAQSVGFGSLSHFIACYRRAFGKTPAVDRAASQSRA